MDWPLQDIAFDEDDFNVFLYGKRKSKAVRRYWGDKSITECWVSEDLEWSKWIEETSHSHPGLAIILGDRERDGTGYHNSSILEHLPFTQTTFERVAGTFPLHGDTARIVNRSDVAFFTDINLLNTSSKAIFYTCRTPSKWPGDLAVSGVFFPEKGFTAALVLGCDKNTAEEISGRIYNSEDASTHPMLIMGIVVEIERERHMELVKKRVYDLLRRVRAISKSEEISATSQMRRENYSVDLWIDVSQLRMALETWKAQLLKMINHIDELEQHILVPDCASMRDRTPSPASSCSEPWQKPGSITPQSCFEIHHQEQLKSKDCEHLKQVESLEDWRSSAIQTGRRIKKRLLEIMCEYDEKIRECTMVIDGMTLSTQLSWNQIGYQDTQTNLKIANDTKQDSSQMKSIAFLTMIFLPATFVASLFSMSFFNWQPSEGEGVISRWVWLYPVITLGVTLVVLTCWYMFTRRNRNHVESFQEKSLV